MGLSTVPKVTGLKDGRPKYDVNPGIVVFLGLGLKGVGVVFGSALGEYQRGAYFSDGFYKGGGEKKIKINIVKSSLCFQGSSFKALIRVDFVSF